MLYGNGLAADPDYAATLALAACESGGAVYVGEATGAGSGVARCVGGGDGDGHETGRRLWYSGRLDGDGDGEETADRQRRTEKIGLQLWNGIQEVGENRHQVLVSSRQSAIDAVLENLEGRLHRAEEDGARRRAVLIAGPDAAHAGLSGLWKRVVEAVGANQAASATRMLERRAVLDRRAALDGDGEAALAARRARIRDWKGEVRTPRGRDGHLVLEAQAVEVESEFWEGWSPPGKTVLIVNAFDAWCRQAEEAGEAWSLCRHLVNDTALLFLGCAGEWPAPGCEKAQLTRTVGVRKIE